MAREVDILIVGAGLAGATTAYHLLRRGRTRILVVEQEAMPGMHSSGRNAAIVREQGVDPAWQALVAEGAAFLRSGLLARFERCGVMLLGKGQEDVRAHFPCARGTGQWCPEDGTVDVSCLLQAYLRGVDVLFNTKVLGWTPSRHAIRVETSSGEIACNLVINAAGPWAGLLGNVPMVPMNRHLFVTTPIAFIDAKSPCVWDVNAGLYFRPESGGLLLSCCDETVAEPGDYREDPAMLDELAQKLCSTQPGLGDLSILSTWVGQRTFTPDRQPIIGFDPRDDRVFHVAGLGGHGVTVSSAVGRLAAELIVGAPREGSNAFSPARVL